MRFIEGCCIFRSLFEPIFAKRMYIIHPNSSKKASELTIRYLLYPRSLQEVTRIFKMYIGNVYPPFPFATPCAPSIPDSFVVTGCGCGKMKEPECIMALQTLLSCAS